jgi:hypothetical protein
MIEAFPLCWPDGWPRTPAHQRKPAPYQVSFARARDDLLGELRLGGCRNVVISSNLALRRDGIPYADCREPGDPGIAVYWDDRKGKPKVIANDCWRTVRENLRAVGLAYASLRQIDRTGSTALLDRAFSGFARLPSGDAPRAWWEVLGVDPNVSKQDLDERFRELAREHHPDRGGDTTTMARITRAYHEAVSA